MFMHLVRVMSLVIYSNHLSLKTNTRARAQVHKTLYHYVLSGSINGRSRCAMGPQRRMKYYQDSMAISFLPSTLKLYPLGE